MIEPEASVAETTRFAEIVVAVDLLIRTTSPMPTTVTLANTTISFREKTSGSGGDRPLQMNVYWDDGDFPLPSFHASGSGMTGGEG